jgi:hypothetical protein
LLTKSTSPSRPIARAATAFFLLFTFMMVTFNRGFAYISFNVHGLPLYVTELCMALIAVAFVLAPELRAPWGSPGVRAFTGLVVALLALTAIKLIFDSSTNPVLALRQAALAYYTLFLLFSLAFNTTEGARWLFGFLVLIASVVMTVICLVSYSIVISWGSLLINFHALPAFMIMGLICFYMINAELIDFTRTPVLSSIFVLELSTLILLGGRSVISGFLLSTGLLLAVFVKNKKGRKTFWFSLLVAGIIAVTLVAGRFMGVLKFRSQDLWQQSWASWGQMDKIVSAKENTPPPPPPPIPAPKSRVTKHHVVKKDRCRTGCRARADRSTRGKSACDESACHKPAHCKPACDQSTCHKPTGGLVRC